MKLLPLAAAAALVGACAAPAVAGAQEVQLGVTPTTPLAAPTCPSGLALKDCTIILPQMTAINTLTDGVSYPTTVTKAGELVAFSVGVSAISSSASTVSTIISSLDSSYGGPPEAQITVLRPVGARRNFRWQVAGQSQTVKLRPFLGDVVQFPLAQSIAVVPGEVVALTIPTWAPVLSFDLSSSKFAYRQSRSYNCGNLATESLPINPQLVIGEQAKYGCAYSGTRVEYTAQEIATPAGMTAGVRRAEIRRAQARRQPRIIRRTRTSS